MAISVPFAIDYDALQNTVAQYGNDALAFFGFDPIVNVSTVVVADSNAGPGDQLEGVQISEADSIAQYGQQAGRLLVTILADTSEAQSLASYLQLPAPVYWFSGIQVQLAALTAGQRTTIAELELGAQLYVSKRFPNVAAPVVQELCVEGLEHQITPEQGHVVTIWTSPADFYLAFTLDVSALDDDAYGLG